jgi:pyruvate dehydrogenase E1 component
MNENYAHPPIPAGVEKDIIKGMYLLREGKANKGPKGSKQGAQKGDRKGELRVQLVGSGTILRELIAGAELLEQDFGVSADIWSATSFNELRRDGLEVQRWNMLHPEAERRVSHVERCLKDRSGPVIAASDYMKIFADQLRPFIPTHNFVALGTDGFGRSDTRKALRNFFEVDRHYVAVAAMKALADEEAVPRAKVTEAIKKYGIDPEKPDPTTV